MKTRRVLGTAKVTCPCKKLLYDKHILNGLACSQEVELAIYEDVQPKRELVVPEGVKIIEECDPSCMNRTDYIILNNKTVGKYHILTDECWVWQENESKMLMTRGGYPRFVFETLAEGGGE
jgi:hypothetical protein